MAIPIPSINKKNAFTSLLLLILLLNYIPAFTQIPRENIKGTLTDDTGKSIPGAILTIKEKGIITNTNNNGQYHFNNLAPENYTILISALGYKIHQKSITIRQGETLELNFVLKADMQFLNEVTVKGIKTITGMGYLDETHDGVIYSGKKTEVILLDSLNANTAQNNPRQILGRIPGANYSETEGGGFPSNGIGFRGLNPSQSVEVNIRQNGYNITADIYGYPETYYTTPLEAVERVEVTRGASSLQFGPQFGGVINYITKKGPSNKPFEVTIQQTGGSFGLFNTFLSAGGRLGKFNYYGYVQYKNLQGWRPNSQYRQVSGFGSLNYQATEKLKLGLEYSILRNRIQMPGGFNDEQFNQDVRASYRARNWLNSPWNIITGTIDYSISPSSTLTVKSAYQFSERNLVWKNEDGGPGTLDTINQVTLQPVNREVQREGFKSTTTEMRFSSKYDLSGFKNTLATGVRFFYGEMKRQGGGLGTTGSDFDLTLLDPHYDYALDFTTTNIAPFVENTIHITDRFSVTPGFRYEYIYSTAKGYITTDDEEMITDASKNRYIALFGISAQFKTTSSTNIYSNITQAYRPVDYSQLTPFGSTSKIDPNMKDAKGYNADLGWRGSFKNYLNFDVSGFYLKYNNRIGLIERKDADGTTYTIRTNVANSIHKGIESYVELNFTKAFFPTTRIGYFSVFNSFSFVDARYTSGEFKNKFVEYAPRTINRLGITYALKPFSTTFLISHTAKSFGDATNQISGTDDPAVGLIPAYSLLDWSGSLKINKYNLKFGVNNLTDKQYFTKRTDEYPGPGIIPSIGRSFYVGIGATF